MKNICLLFGGKSFESEVSIISAFSAYHTIFDIYKIYMIYIKNGKNYFCKNLQKIIKMQKNEKITLPEVFFAGGKMFYKSNLKRPVSVYCALNCCHGGSGEDGGVAGMLDVAEIPYTSAGIAFSALFMDKELSKMVLTEKGFPVLPYTLLRIRDMAHISDYPRIIKPARLGSSIGIRIVHNKEELLSGAEIAFHFDDKLICEPLLESPIELNCAAYKGKKGIVVSDVEKVTFDGDFYDFESKYKGENASRQIPAEIPNDLYNKVQDMTKDVYEKCEAKGVIRVDYLISQQGELYINEINTIPGSLALYLFSQKGGAHRVLSEIIEEGRREYERQNERITESDGSFLRNFDFSSLEKTMKK